MKKNRNYAELYENLKNKADRTETDNKLLNMIEQKAEKKFSKGTLGGFLAFNGKVRRIRSKKISMHAEGKKYSDRKRKRFSKHKK